MLENISILSVAATGLYALVVLACIAASATAMRRHQQKWHRNAWACLAILFVALIFLRGWGIEEWLRGIIRETLRSDGAYAERRSYQSLIVAAVLAIIAGLGSWWSFRISKGLRGRRNYAVVAALGSGGAMIFLIALRMISLHAIDRFLYGPLKLNWVGDIGASVVILGAALYYVKIVRARR